MARDWKASARLPSLFNSRLTTWKKTTWKILKKTTWNICFKPTWNIQKKRHEIYSYEILWIIRPEIFEKRWHEIFRKRRHDIFRKDEMKYLKNHTKDTFYEANYRNVFFSFPSYMFPRALLFSYSVNIDNVHLLFLWYCLRPMGLKESVRNIKLTCKNEIEKRNINAKKKTIARFHLQLETITGKSSELSGSVLNPSTYIFYFAYS